MKDLSWCFPSQSVRRIATEYSLIYLQSKLKIPELLSKRSASYQQTLQIVVYKHYENKHSMNFIHCKTQRPIR